MIAPHSLQSRGSHCRLGEVCTGISQCWEPNVNTFGPGGGVVRFGGPIGSSGGLTRLGWPGRSVEGTGASAGRVVFPGVGKLGGSELKYPAKDHGGRKRTALRLG